MGKGGVERRKGRKGDWRRKEEIGEWGFGGGGGMLRAVLIIEIIEMDFDISGGKVENGSVS